MKRRAYHLSLIAVLHATTGAGLVMMFCQNRNEYTDIYYAPLLGFTLLGISLLLNMFVQENTHKRPAFNWRSIVGTLFITALFAVAAAYFFNYRSNFYVPNWTYEIRTESSRYGASHFTENVSGERLNRRVDVLFKGLGYVSTSVALAFVLYSVNVASRARKLKNASNNKPSAP